MTERGPKGEPGKEETKQPIYDFPAETFIYWEDSGAPMGTIQADLQAIRLPGKPKNRLYQYKVTSLWTIEVYYNNRTRNIGYGSIFRAFTPKSKPHLPH